MSTLNTFETSWQPVLASAGLPSARTDLFTQQHYDALVGAGAISGLAAFLGWYKDKFDSPLIDAWAAANPGADTGNTLNNGADAIRRIVSGEPLGSLLMDVPGAKEAAQDVAVKGVVLAGIVVMGVVGAYKMVSGGLP